MIAIFDNWIGEYGLVGAAKRLLKTFSVKIKVLSLPEGTQELLKNSPVLVMANHDTDQEPLALLASLPSREDIFLVGSYRLQRIKNLAPHILPVNVDSQRKTSKKRSLSTIIGKLRKTSKDMWAVTRNNLGALSNAVEKIDNGSMLIIFPQGVNKGHKWQSGVKFISKRISNPEAKMVFAYIANTSNWDFLRVLPIVRRMFPEIKVHFSEPRDIPKTYSVEKLRKEYYKWVSTL